MLKQLLRCGFVLGCMLCRPGLNVCLAQDTTFTVRGYTFGIVKLPAGDEGPMQEDRIELVRKEASGLRPLLSHTLVLGWGDCNSEAYEIGSWEVRDTLIYFWSKWIKAGDAPGYPYGVRKQVYRVASDGKVIPLSSVCWIAEGSMSEIARETDWVFEKDEKELRDPVVQANWKKYMDYIRDEYHAHMVPEDERNALVQEVDKALHDLTEAVAGRWEKVEVYRNFGIEK